MFSNANETAESGGTNGSSQNDSFDSSISAITLAERLTVPFICILGLIGNTFSFVVFLQKSMRKKSCSLYLAVRSFSDNGFILTLLVVWISSVLDLRLSKVVGICQSITFLTYVFGCVSVWLVVFVTFENYVRICKPYRVKSFCKASNAKYAVIILFLCVLCGYNFPLWTINKECKPEEKHYGFIKIMVYADSLLTLVFPTLILSVLMTQIAITSCTIRRRLSSTAGKRKHSRPMTKVTKMLIAVTLVFFILNMPSHAVRIRLVVTAFIENKRDITGPLDLTLQSVSQLIYYLSLAVNIFVYYFFGSTFRTVFCGLLHRKKEQIYFQVEHRDATISMRRKQSKYQNVPAEDLGYIKSIDANDLNADETAHAQKLHSSVV